MRGAFDSKEDHMQAHRITPVDHPGALVRASYAVGRRLFGDVPTPQKLMAHRPALMLGMGALWASIERFGALDGRLRALLQLQGATLYDAAY
jgi:hypothetical protein